MRKLGALLGVEAMALYHYFPSKAALLDEVVALVLGQLALPDGHPRRKRDDWPALIRQVARSFRQLGRAHPHVFPLLATVGFDNPATLAPAEAVLAVLARAGLAPADAFAAFVALKSYVVGQVLWANAARASAPLQPQVPAATYPHLAAYVGSAGADPIDLEANFEAGLELLIDGIRARLGPRQ
jgi:AcrR family transcriptional regulator